MSSLLQKHGVVYSTTTNTSPPIFSDTYLQQISLHLQIHETTWSTTTSSIRPHDDHIPDSHHHHLQSCSFTGLVPFTSTPNTIIPPSPDSLHNATLSSPLLLDDHQRLVSPKKTMRRKKMNISHQEKAGDHHGKRKKQFKKNGSFSFKTNNSESEMETMIKLETEAKKPNGFVRVRARRGQATDSHSLAERARREKISMRMKLLESLVPGCDKITGKAHILDEIINYVQSLQNQVQCLAAKLAFVDLMLADPLTSTLPESQYCLDPPLSSVLESSSTGQFGSFADIEPTHVSLVQDQRYMDDGNINPYSGVGEDIINQCGLVDLCTF